MIAWTTFQSAALEYSRMRPRLVYEELVPVFDERIQTLPDNCFGVQTIDYGVWAPYDEVMSAEETDILWDDTNGVLALNPAPNETDNPTIVITWKMAHEADEETESFPTIPFYHIPFVEDLELARLLETEADEIELGPQTYTIGQTQIDRKGAAAGLRIRAARLREAVAEKLGEPTARWS